MNGISLLMLDIFRLECLFQWGLAVAVKNAIGKLLNADDMLKVEGFIISRHMLFENVNILPKELRYQVIQSRILIICIIIVFLVLGMVSKCME